MRRLFQKSEQLKMKSCVNSKHEDISEIMRYETKN